MKKKFLLTGIIILILTLSGCQDLFSPEIIKLDNKEQELIDNLPEGYGAVRISFAKGAARTLIPEPELSVFSFEYFFSPEEGGEAEPIDPIDDLFILQEGNYRLLVRAYIGEDEAAQGETAEPFEVIAGELTPDITVTLHPFVSEGTGSFEFTLNYPPNTIINFLTLTRLPGGVEYNLMDTNPSASGTNPVTLTGLLEDIEVGYYLLDVELMNQAGAITGTTEVVHIYKNLVTKANTANYTFVANDFGAILVTNNNDSGPGSLRNALLANSGDVVKVMLEPGSVIELESGLSINRSLAILGNGITLTRSPSWTATNVSLLTVSSYVNISISRIHFKDGRSTGNGGAINNNYTYGGQTMLLESCIFSGNSSGSNGGAIFISGGSLTLITCTFYGNNSALRGGAVASAGGTLNLSGNLFYGNTAVVERPVIFALGTVVSGGYNVVDKTIGTNDTESGWVNNDDKEISEIPVSPQTFRLLLNSEAAGVINQLPEGYPREDFYGVPIAENAAAGAVQDFVNGGYYLDLQYNTTRGIVAVSPLPDVDGMVSGLIELLATPYSSFEFSHWLVDESSSINENPMQLTPNNHVKIQAVFTFTSSLLVVNNFSDAPGSENIPGTLRFVLTHADDGSIITFEGVTPGQSVIELTSRLEINKSLTIEGSGITLTRGPSWTQSTTSQLLYIDDGEVRINRIHFKDGLANGGGAIRSLAETLTLESCIFSSNQSGMWNGGAISHSELGSLFVKGCTFFSNGPSAAIYTGGPLELIGNLFYGNIGSLVSRGSTATVVSNGYNVVDVAIGTGSNASGWTNTTGTDVWVTDGLPLSPLTFRPLAGFGADNIIPTLPADYPTVDFYGAAIIDGASVGAVQEVINDNFFDIELTTNYSEWGSIEISPVADASGLYPGGTVTLTANPNSGYLFSHWLKDGVNAGSENPWDMDLDSPARIHAVFIQLFAVTNLADTSGSATNVTLRYALANANDGDIIRFTGVTPRVSEVQLTSRLESNKNITIEGNGVTITRSPSWTTIDENSQLLIISSGTVKISRVHFKDGAATHNGSVIRNSGTLTLESCIFSGNRITVFNSGPSGVIFNNSGNLTVKGCTFYNNTSSAGSGAIYTSGSTSTVDITGNLFYGNTFSLYYESGLVHRVGGTLTSGGFNVTDVAYGTAPASGQSGWDAVNGDKQVNALPISGKTFRPISAIGATNVITTLPDGYPTIDFYGDPIIDGAAAGAVQSTRTGYYIDLTINDSTRGSVNITPASDDSLYTGSITMTANAAANCEFMYWLQDGVNIGSANPRTFTINSHLKIEAVYKKTFIIDNFSDTAASVNTPGTIRHAFANVLGDSDIIWFANVTPGESEIELSSSLVIDRNIKLNIEGNGITLTRNAHFPILSISRGEIKIDRIHFKGDSDIISGAAIFNNGGTLTMESCIFSNNRIEADSTLRDVGGAITNRNSTLTVKGCTFYGNSVGGFGGGAIFNSGTLTLTGNLFYGHTFSPRRVLDNRNVTTPSYNVVDVNFGTGDAQSGWNVGTGDKRIYEQPVTAGSFMLFPGSEAVNVITTLPADYPTTDFYGSPISNGAAAGAVQVIRSDGFYFNLEEIDTTRGTVSVTPVPDKDSYYSGATTVTLTAIPNSGRTLSFWLINDTVYTGTGNTLTYTVNSYTKVQPVFDGWLVNNFEDFDGNPGNVTLRYAITHSVSGDIISFKDVMPGTTAIELTSLLPEINKSINIIGNGITLTRHPSWENVNNNRLLWVSGSNNVVYINRVHFKGGRTIGGGAAIRNATAHLILESCIFSDNLTSGSDASGGAVRNVGGSLTVKGCTFYWNRAAAGGAIHHENNGLLIAIGNLFYGNTASEGAAIYLYYANNYITSNNAVDVAFGTTGTQGFWSAGVSDRRFSDLGISGDPIDTTTFAPLSSSLNIVSLGFVNFPATDFYGNLRTFPAAAGAVRQ